MTDVSDNIYELEWWEICGLYLGGMTAGFLFVRSWAWWFLGVTMASAVMWWGLGRRRDDA